MLLVFEIMTTGSTGFSIAEMVIYMVIMARNKLSEGSYQALAVVCDTMDIEVWPY